MKEKDKAQEQLVDELDRLRRRVSELEAADAERSKAQESFQLQEKRFQAIAENSSDVIILLDTKGTVLYESPAMEHLLGLNPRDRVGVNVFERIHPEDVSAVTERFQGLLQNPDSPVQRVEVRLRHKDDSWRTVEASGSAVMRDSVIEGLVINLHDLTDRKKAEEILQRSEERFRGLVESASDVTVVLGSQGNIIYLSPNFEKVWGLKAEGVLGQDMFKNIHPDDIPLTGKFFTDIIKNPQKTMHMQLRAQFPDGTWHTLDAEARNHLDDPAIGGIVANFHDVTELKRAQGELSEVKEWIEQIIGLSKTNIDVIDGEFNLRYVDPEWRKVYGDPAGRKCYEYFRGQKEACRDCVIPDAFRTHQPSVAEHVLPRENNRIVEVHTIPFQSADGEWLVSELNVDITERNRAEEAIKIYRDSIDTAFDGIVMTDLKGNVTYANTSACKMLGYLPEDALRLKIASLTSDPLNAERIIEQVLQTGKWRGDITAVKKNGEAFPAIFSGSLIVNDKGMPIATLGIFRDITERKKMEKALRDSSQQWQATFDAASDAICLLDADQRIQRCNRTMSEMFNITEKEIIGRHCWEVVHGTTEPIPECPITRTKSSLVREEMELQRGDRWFNVTVDPVLDENHAIQGFVHIVRDITERKRAEEALKDGQAAYQKQNEILNTLLDNLSNGVFMVEAPSGRPIIANLEAQRLLGRGIIPDASKENLAEVYSAHKPGCSTPYPMEELPIVRGMNGESAHVDDMIVERPDGTGIWLEVFGSPIRNEHGDVWASLISFQNITERKRVEEALRESEEKYSTLVEKATDGVTIIQDKLIRFANKSMAEMSGYTVEELAGMSTFDLVPPDFIPVLQERFRLRAEGKEVPEIFETRMLCKEGTVKEMENSTKLIQYEGRPAVIAITRDVTGRKRMEKALRESEEKYRLLADNASDVIMLMNMSAKPVYFSPSVTRLLGYSVEEALTGTMEGRMTPASMEKAVKHFMIGLDRDRRDPGGSPGQTLELDMIHKNGSIVVIEMMVSFIRDANGKPTGMMAILRDVTERKKTEAEIMNLSNALRATLDPVLILDMEGNVRNTNEAARKLFETEELGTSALKYVDPEDRERVGAILQGLIANGQPAVAQYNVVTRSGRRVPIEASGSLILDAEGKPTGIVIVERDLTERRQAEAHQKLAAEILGILNEPMALPDAIERILVAIKRETGFYAVGIRLRQGDDFPYFVQNGFSDDFLLTENTLVERGPDGGPCRDENGNVSLECTCGLVISGKTDPSNPLFTPGGSAWTNDSIPLLDIPPEQDPRHHPRNRCIHAGFQSVALMPIRSGEEIVGLLQLNDRRKGCFTPEMIRFFEGIAASIGVALVRKQAEDALRESEERYRKIANCVPDLIWMMDLSGHFTYANPAVERFYGLTVEEYKGRAIDQIVTPRQAEIDVLMLAEELAKAAEPGYDRNSVRTWDSEEVRKDGSIFKSEVTASLLFGDDGKPNGVIGVGRDITERLKAQEALRESEKKMRTLSEVSPDIIMSIDRQGKILFINRATTKTVEETIGTRVFEYIPPEYQSLYAETIEHVFITGKPDSIETKGLGPGRRMSWYEARFASLRSGDDEAQSLMVVATDITERKQAEQALKESEEKFRTAFDSANTGMCLVSLSGNLIKVNDKMSKILGYSVEELERMTVNSIAHPDDLDASLRFMEKALGGQIKSSTFEKRFLTKDGRMVWGLVSSALVHDAEGESLYFISQVQDITERKRIEEVLRESEEKYRMLVEGSADLIFSLDAQGNFTYLSPAIERLSGYRPGDIVGKPFVDFVLPEDLPGLMASFEKTLGGSSEPAEFRTRSKDGIVRWVRTVSKATLSDGQVLGVTGIMSEITERKRSEEALKESEKKMRALSENSPDVIMIIDREGRILFINRTVPEMTIEEVLGQCCYDYLAPEYRQAYMEIVERIIRTGVNDRAETRGLGPGGEMFWYETRFVSLQLEGEGQTVMLIARDITERKKAEEALIRINKAVESSSDAIGISDAQGHHFYHNSAFTELFEYTPEELEAAGGGPAVYANKHVARKVFDTIMGGGSWIGEVEMVSKSGRTFTVLERADAIKDEKGKVIGLVGVHTDITERKKAEEKLRETRDYMENLIEHANVPMVIWTTDFRITRFNRAFERLTGMKAKSVIGKDLEILFPKGTRERSMSFIRTAMRGARWEVVDIPIANVDGDARTVLWNISPIYKEDGKTPMAIIAQGQDITERKKTEEALRESEELSRSMLESAAMGIYLLQNKRFIYVNPMFEEIIGYSSEELVGQETINYVHPDDRDTVRNKAVENIQGVSAQPYEFRALRKDGRQIWVMERVTPVRYKGRRAVLASFMETTEHKKAEVELQRAYEDLKTMHENMVQSQKLRAMGEMASGIAHDFNNMLAVILGRTQLVIDDVKDDKVKKGIQVIEQAALDAAKTVKRLQDFARIRVEHPFEPLDVNEVVEGVLKMVESRRVELEQTKGIAIKVEQELGKIGKVSGDAAELREALLNILFNALDAMPTGGKLIVKTLQDEEWVQITIKDTGVGIPDKVKAKVFEPFFTTKSSKGSGLGLSVTYGIIARHGGMIKFDSEVGKGTAFYIRLPLAVEEVRKQARKSKVVSAKPASILTVDDEPEVLKALGLTLEYFGHWVKDFTSGAEAIKAFKDGKYDVVITDLGMPEVSGWDVARAIKKIKPDVPVLLITGWVIDLDDEQKKLVDGVIAKPFSRESIASAIAKVFPVKKKSTANKKQAVKKSAVKKSSGKKKSG